MYEGFRSFGVEEIPDLGNVTQLKKEQIYRPLLCGGPLTKNCQE